MPSLKECSSLYPPRQGIILTVQLQQSLYRKTGINLHPLNSIKIFEGKLKHDYTGNQSGIYWVVIALVNS